jgi:hypothetical protein
LVGSAGEGPSPGAASAVSAGTESHTCTSDMSSWLGTTVRSSRTMVCSSSGDSEPSAHCITRPTCQQRFRRGESEVLHAVREV